MNVCHFTIAIYVCHNKLSTVDGSNSWQTITDSIADTAHTQGGILHLQYTSH